MFKNIIKLFFFLTLSLALSSKLAHALDYSFRNGFFGDFGNYFDIEEEPKSDDHSFQDNYINWPKKSLPLNHNNVILITADDLGLDLLSIYEPELRGEGRSEFAYTPNIDKLARDGVTFRRAYAYPTCSPTRSSMLTGRYGFRTGVTYAIGRICPIGLTYPQPTIPLSLPSHVKKACFGKWHLRSEDQSDLGVDHVIDAGFDVYDGLLAGAISPMEPSYTYWTRSHSNTGPYETDVMPTYFTTYITDRAIDWIEENEDEQFFLWLAHVAPHTPLHRPPSNLISHDPGTCHMRVSKEQGVKCASAAIEALDTEIGRLLDSMSDEVREHTTVIFLGDNGNDSAYSDGKPFTADKVKNTLHEGGIRIPFIISGNLVTARGTRSDNIIQTVDVFSTVLDIMGGHHPNVKTKIDSYSMVSLMKNPRIGLRTFAFSELKGPGHTCDNTARGLKFYYGDALIESRFKLITPFDYDSNNDIVELPERLYDLIEDPFERYDLLETPEDELDLKLLLELKRMRNKRLSILESY